MESLSNSFAARENAHWVKTKNTVEGIIGFAGLGFIADLLFGAIPVFTTIGGLVGGIAGYKKKTRSN